jgi:hypothetical protein
MAEQHEKQKGDPEGAGGYDQYRDHEWWKIRRCWSHRGAPRIAIQA